MKKIITIGGSTSKQSINKKLAEYVGNQLSGVELIKINLNDFEAPLFSVDVENEHGFPEQIIKLNNIISKADGFVISLAEHNGAYSAAFKNVFDWLSRIDGKVWRNKPMLLLSTSPGARGGQSVLEIAKNRFPYMGAEIIGFLAFPSFNENFMDDEVVNKELKKSIEEMISMMEDSL